jgi:hypothetical protein
VKSPPWNGEATIFLKCEQGAVENEHMKQGKIDRRDFLAFIAGTSLGTAIGLSSLMLGAKSAAGGGAGTAASGGNCDRNGSAFETSGASGGHTHSIQLTAGEISASNTGFVYTTASTLGHTHSFQLTAAQYANLNSNQGISVQTGPASDGNSHSHTFVINCA